MRMRNECMSISVILQIPKKKKGMASRNEHASEQDYFYHHAKENLGFTHLVSFDEIGYYIEVNKEDNFDYKSLVFLMTITKSWI